MAEYEAGILVNRMDQDMNNHELVVICDSYLLIIKFNYNEQQRILRRLSKIFRKKKFNYTSRIQDKLVYALTTISSMRQHL